METKKINNHSITYIKMNGIYIIICYSFNFTTKLREEFEFMRKGIEDILTFSDFKTKIGNFEVCMN